MPLLQRKYRTCAIVYHIRDIHDKDVWYQWVDKVLEKIAESENFDNMVDAKSDDNSKTE